jgi:hypothetical protein
MLGSDLSHKVRPLPNRAYVPFTLSPMISRRLVLVALWLLVIAAITLCTTSDVRVLLQWNAIKLSMPLDGVETVQSSTPALASIDSNETDDIIRMELLWADHEVKRYQAVHGYAPIRTNLAYSSSSLRRRR